MIYVFLLLFNLTWANDDARHPEPQDWSFNTPLGTFDRAELQRGFQVYKDVCAACHSLSRLRFRELKALGFKESHIKTIASEYQVTDGPNEEGESYERAALPSDSFPAPYPNEQAARTANGGAYPLDLSLITKAREGGADYLYALLTGYETCPKTLQLFEGKHYNPYFPGNQISMPPPLSEGLVTYTDGTPATVRQMARDVTAFLAWVSEPELEARHAMGIKVLVFLFVLSLLLYAVYRNVWRRVS